jgi:hypothetical protein
VCDDPFGLRHGEDYALTAVAQRPQANRGEHASSMRHAGGGLVYR